MGEFYSLRVENPMLKNAYLGFGDIYIYKVKLECALHEIGMKSVSKGVDFCFSFLSVRFSI